MGTKPDIIATWYNFRSASLRVVLLFWGMMWMFAPFAEAFDMGPCSNPDTSPTVVVDGCATGVSNAVLLDGCTISDRISQCAANAYDHSIFVCCVGQVTNTLNKEGVISGKEKGKIQSCAAKANLPCTSCEGYVPAAARYCFEFGTDPMSLALQHLYDSYNYMPKSAAEFEVINRLASQGREYLKQHPDEAANLLIGEASRLAPGLMLTFACNTLGYLDSAQAVDYLYGLASRPLPDINFVGELRARDHFMLRETAVSQLGRLKRAGNARAKECLLGLVASPDNILKRSAIRTFYHTSTIRWLAKHEMRKRLAPDEQYLLHEIY